MFRRDEIPGIQPIYVCTMCAHVKQQQPSEERWELGIRLIEHVSECPGMRVEAVS